MVKTQYTLEERLAKVKELRAQGYNCAQAVTMVFDDIKGIDTRSAEIYSAALGGGFGGCGLTCGAVSAMGMVSGVAHYENPLKKKELYAGVKSLSEKFLDSNGSLLCRDLRQPGKKSCDELIREAVTLLHNQLASND